MKLTSIAKGVTIGVGLASIFSVAMLTLCAVLAHVVNYLVGLIS